MKRTAALLIAAFTVEARAGTLILEEKQGRVRKEIAQETAATTHYDAATKQLGIRGTTGKVFCMIKGLGAADAVALSSELRLEQTELTCTAQKQVTVNDSSSGVKAYETETGEYGFRSRLK